MLLASSPDVSLPFQDEVVALRKRVAREAHERICSLSATPREIAEIAELAGPDSLSRVLDRARAATRKDSE